MDELTKERILKAVDELNEGRPEENQIHVVEGELLSVVETFLDVVDGIPEEQEVPKGVLDVFNVLVNIEKESITALEEFCARLEKEDPIEEVKEEPKEETKEEPKEEKAPPSGQDEKPKEEKEKGEKEMAKKKSEKTGKVKAEKKKEVPAKKNDQSKKQPVTEEKEIINKGKGYKGTCRELILQGKKEEDVKKVLAEMYTKLGKDEKYANARAYAIYRDVSKEETKV